MVRPYEGTNEGDRKKRRDVVVVDPLENPYAYRPACMLVDKGLLKKVGGEGFSPAFLVAME